MLSDARPAVWERWAFSKIVRHHMLSPLEPREKQRILGATQDFDLIRSGPTGPLFLFMWHMLRRVCCKNCQRMGVTDANYG